jgi:hypothetical protein
MPTVHRLSERLRTGVREGAPPPAPPRSFLAERGEFDRASATCGLASTSPSSFGGGASLGERRGPYAPGCATIARSSSGVTVATPGLPTSMPAARFASTAASCMVAQAASATATKAVTVSPAPLTS